MEMHLSAASRRVANSQRSLELDFLRCVAVALVILRHLAPYPADTPAAVRAVLEIAGRMGWMGVDLFFVLSGYLISGLLFREYLQHGRMRLGRFLIRRGLKIYPSFYLLIFASVAAGVAQGWHVPWKKLLAEVFFYQNYVTGLWSHTWSLAVEEHFYLTLPVVLLVLMRRGGAGAPNPFQWLPKLFIVVASGILAARLLTMWAMASEAPDQDRFLHTQVFPTHLRIDALGFGVILSYLHHFRTASLVAWVRRWRWALAGMFLCGVVPSAIWELEKTPFLYTIGFTLVYLGMGSLLLLCLVQGLPRSRVFRGAAWMGSFSYSVYLWHLAVAMVLHLAQQRWPGIPWWLTMGSFIAGSFGAGIILGKCVELPVLALRDRYFPSRSKPLGSLNQAANDRNT